MNSVRATLREAARLLRSTYPDFPSGRGARFNVEDRAKRARIAATDDLGSFDAWDDKLRLNLEIDPLGTAVHELLHANAFSDDWLPDDTGRDEILSFRGFEIQRLTPDREHVIAIYHRGLNEGVTELLTKRAYQPASPAYVELVPLAEEVESRIGLDLLARIYFDAGYPGLEARLGLRALHEISARADRQLSREGAAGSRICRSAI